MKASDYLVDYLITKCTTDVSWYLGGMGTHFMDSFGKRSKEIQTNITNHEQSVAFATWGYAQKQ